MLICSAFVRCSVSNIQRADTVIRYIEVDFTLGLSDYVRYIEEFVKSRLAISRFSVPYILL